MDEIFFDKGELIMNKDGLGGFIIVCPDCEAKKKKHHTLLYVDWRASNYMITCETCGKTSIFNLLGELLGPADLALLGGNKNKFIS